MTEEKRPNPSDPDYWMQIEAEAQDEEVQQILRSYSMNHRLNQLLQEEISKLPSVQVDAIKRKVLNSKPSSTPDLITNAEIATQLIDLVKVKALERLRMEEQQQVGYKQNPMEEMASQVQCRKWLEELQDLLQQIQHGRSIIRNHTNLEEMLLYPTDLTALGSLLNSWNNLAVELSQSGYQISVFEPLPMPKSERMQWIAAVRNGLLLTDSELQEHARIIATYLSRPITMRL